MACTPVTDIDVGRLTVALPTEAVADRPVTEIDSLNTAAPTEAVADRPVTDMAPSVETDMR